MKTTVKKLSDTRIEVTAVLDAEDLKAPREKAIERLAKEVKVEGFRKGKTPAKVAEKYAQIAAAEAAEAAEAQAETEAEAAAEEAQAEATENAEPAEEAPATEA